MDVSVIITVAAEDAGSGRGLSAALASVVAQTTSRRLDVIVVPVGPPAAELHNIIEPYTQRYASPHAKVQVRFARDEQFPNEAAACRWAVEHTQGPFVAFLRSRDYWDRFKLERQFTAIGQGRHVDVVHTAHRVLDGNGEFLDEQVVGLDNPCLGRCLDKILAGFEVTFSSLLLRRSILERIAADKTDGALFDVQAAFGFEHDLQLYLARHGHFVFIPEPLTFVRPPVISRAAQSLEALREICRVRFAFVDRFESEMHLNRHRVNDALSHFLHEHAQGFIDQGEPQAAQQVCELAGRLDLGTDWRDTLRHTTTRPRWLQSIQRMAKRLWQKDDK